MKKSIGFLLVMGMLGGGGEVGAQQAAVDLAGGAQTQVAVNNKGIGWAKLREWLEQAGLGNYSFKEDAAYAYANASDLGRIIRQTKDPKKLSHLTRILSENYDGRIIFDDLPQEALRDGLITLINNNPNAADRYDAGGSLCYFAYRQNIFTYGDFLKIGFQPNEIENAKRLIGTAPIGDGLVEGNKEDGAQFTMFGSAATLFDQPNAEIAWGEIRELVQKTKTRGVPINRLSKNTLISMAKSPKGASMMVHSLEIMLKKKSGDAESFALLANAVTETKEGLRAYNARMSKKMTIDLALKLAKNQAAKKLPIKINGAITKLFAEKGLDEGDIKSQLKPEECANVRDLVQGGALTLSGDALIPPGQLDVFSKALFTSTNGRHLSQENRIKIWHKLKETYKPESGETDISELINAKIPQTYSYLLKLGRDSEGMKMLQNEKSKIKQVASETRVIDPVEEQEKAQLLSELDGRPSKGADFPMSSGKEKK